MSTVAFDFDGVIHRYSRGWQDGSIYDEPVEGVFELIESVQQEHAVFIHTTREPISIVSWLIKHRHHWMCVTYHEPNNRTVWWYSDGAQFNQAPSAIGNNEYGQPFPKFWDDRKRILITDRKLPALAYIDDRAVRFLNAQQAQNELIDRGVLPLRTHGRGVASTLDDRD